MMFQATTSSNKPTQNLPQNMQRDEGEYRWASCGKVEFCLPTKLHVPHSLIA